MRNWRQRSRAVRVHANAVGPAILVTVVGGGGRSDDGMWVPSREVLGSRRCLEAGMPADLGR